ncbi:MAG: NAD(P)/FAD-dependent oxidoreductase [Gemmatimonadetes bacterium]|nr:NAD(P)/FAD-dependent oxidoreductase [Gemmatimonadota bacterium]
MNSQDEGARPRVVVIGAGFAGLQCARRLAGEPVDVLVLDRENHHLFTPLLYQVASALLNPSDIANPVRRIFQNAGNVRVRMAEVEGVDFAGRRVALADGTSIPYDRVVVACGSRTNWFGMDGMASAALPLKNLPDALALRNHVLACFEAAAFRDPTERAALMRFVVVGGGPTGVEYAGALSELIRRPVRRDFPDLDIDRARVVLIEAGPSLLTGFPAELGDYARRELERRGVEVLLETPVVGGDEREVRLGSEARIETRTIVWTAGVRPARLVDAMAVPKTDGGRIEVDERLRIVGVADAFAAGDAAAARSRGGTPLPMMAPPAMQAGRHAADNVLRDLRGEPLRGFAYRDKGTMATIGRSAAVAAIGRVRLKGFPGWILWLALHLFYLIGFRNRLAVLLEWTWDYLRWDRPIRLITRARGDPAAPRVG